MEYYNTLNQHQQAVAHIIIWLVTMPFMAMIVYAIGFISKVVNTYLTCYISGVEIEAEQLKKFPGWDIPFIAMMVVWPLAMFFIVIIGTIDAISKLPKLVSNKFFLPNWMSVENVARILNKSIVKR